MEECLEALHQAVTKMIHHKVYTDFLFGKRRRPQMARSRYVINEEQIRRTEHNLAS
jgi:hypothetical protein